MVGRTTRSQRKRSTRKVSAELQNFAKEEEGQPQEKVKEPISKLSSGFLEEESADLEEMKEEEKKESAKEEALKPKAPAVSESSLPPAADGYTEPSQGFPSYHYPGYPPSSPFQPPNPTPHYGAYSPYHYGYPPPPQPPPSGDKNPEENKGEQTDEENLAPPAGDSQKSPNPYYGYQPHPSYDGYPEMASQGESGPGAGHAPYSHYGYYSPNYYRQPPPPGYYPPTYHHDSYYHGPSLSEQYPPPQPPARLPENQGQVPSIPDNLLREQDPSDTSGVDDIKPQKEEQQGQEEQDDDEDNDKQPDFSKLKTWVRPAAPVGRHVLARRESKNAASRKRASLLRNKISQIEAKSPSSRTEEEAHMLQVHYDRRERKNSRSRERVQERNQEKERILSKAPDKRTKLEIAFLDNTMSKRARKNEGDRLRRARLKHLGIGSRDPQKPKVTARGPMPAVHHGHNPPQMQLPPPPPGMYPHTQYSPYEPQYQYQFTIAQAPPWVGPPPSGPLPPSIAPREANNDSAPSPTKEPVQETDV